MLKFIARHMPVALGLLFLYSGASKILHPAEAVYALFSLDVPKPLSEAVIVVVTALELYLGVILLLKKDLKWGLGASTALMFSFTVFLWYLATLANPPSCGCLGLTGIFTSNKQAAMFGVLRNCLILWGLKLSYDYYVRPTGEVDDSTLKVSQPAPS